MLPETGYVKLTEEETQFYRDSLDERSEIIIQDTFELGEPESVRIKFMLTFCVPHTEHRRILSV